MSAAPHGEVKEQGRSEYGVALFLGAVGVAVIADALSLADSVIARGPVGPRVVPLAVGGPLVVVAVLLALDVRRGGRGGAEGGEGIQLTRRGGWRTLPLLLAPVVAHPPPV